MQRQGTAPFAHVMFFPLEILLAQMHPSQNCPPNLLKPCSVVESSSVLHYRTHRPSTGFEFRGRLRHRTNYSNSCVQQLMKQSRTRTGKISSNDTSATQTYSLF